MKNQLVGIQGWLILPAIGLAVNPILVIIGILVSLGSMEKMIDQGYGVYSFAWVLLNLGILVYSIIAAVKFFKRRKDAPGIVMGLMVARAITSLVLFLISLAVIQSEDPLTIILLLRSNNFIAQGIAAAIWIPYFKKSKRVQATFVN